MSWKNRIREGQNVADIPVHKTFTQGKPDSEGQLGLYSEKHATEVDMLDLGADMVADGMYLEAAECLHAIAKGLQETPTDKYPASYIAEELRRAARTYITEIMFGDDSEELIIQPVEDSVLLKGAQRLLAAISRTL